MKFAFEKGVSKLHVLEDSKIGPMEVILLISFWVPIWRKYWS